MYLYVHIQYIITSLVQCKSHFIGTDEKAIISVLAYRSNSQRQKIKLKFKTLYGRVSCARVHTHTHIHTHTHTHIHSHMCNVHYYCTIHW